MTRKSDDTVMGAARRIAALVAAACLCAAPIAGAAAEDAPDATIEIMGGSFAIGIGFDWANGTLRFQGDVIPIDAQGVSIARIGAGNYVATGRVYHLHDLADFPGTYASVSAGATLLHGGSALAMRNDKGVVIEMTSSMGGIDLDFGVKGLAFSVR
jgi:hypothetical protein